MPTTEEALQEKRDEVARLRQQVEEEEAARLEREQELSNDITAAELDAEAAHLNAKLAVMAQVEAASTESAPLDAAKAAEEQAVAQQKAAEDATEAATESAAASSETKE